ncbi:MAG: hypothetical protein WAM73_15155 [Desulfobacterales bacterium]
MSTRPLDSDKAGVRNMPTNQPSEQRCARESRPDIGSGVITGLRAAVWQGVQRYTVRFSDWYKQYFV